MGYRIRDLQGATLPLTGNEILELEQGGNSRQVRLLDLLPGFDDTLGADLANNADAAKGAALVGYKGRTQAAKNSDIVSLLDFTPRAVGDSGTTNNRDAITAAISAAAGRVIYVPVDASGGQYAVTSGTLTIPAGQRFLYEGNARIYAAGGTISDSGWHVSLMGAGSTTLATRGISVNLAGGNTGSVTGLGAAFNMLRHRADRLDGTTGGGTKVNAMLIDHAFGGAGTRGGRHGLEISLTQTGATEADNSDRNYVGIASHVQTSTGDGGTSGALRGAYFGGESFAYLMDGAMYAHNCTGHLFEVGIQPGASARNREAIQITAKYGQRGTDKDSAISISCATGAATFQNVFYVNNLSLGSPVDATSTVLKVQSGLTVGDIINAEGVTYSRIIETSLVRLTDALFQLKSSGAAIRLGALGAANSPYVNFNSGATSVDWDARLTASGGTGANGKGVLSLSADVFATSASAIRGSTDNVTALGAASFRFTQVFAATGTINTSDERSKQQIKPIDEACLRAWANVEYMQYKFNDAVEEKGDGARWHFGLIAQRVQEAFANEGLDALEYGLLCYDEWPEQPEITDDEGNVLQGFVAAGSRYGIRYEEALAIECAYLRSQLKNQ